MKPAKLAPFTCSAAAHRSIRLFLYAEPDMDTALILSEGGEMRKGQVTLLKFQGNHFFLEHHRKGELPEDSFYILDGLQVSIGPSALEHLKGKKLVEKCYRFGPRHLLTLFFPRYQMSVLATEPDAAPNGGPATPSANFKGTERPPSVS